MSVPDEFGDLFDELRLGRATGRVFGHVLASPPERRTAEDAATTLGLSRGAVSQALTLLREAQLVEREVKPGVRRHHYRVRGGQWAGLMRRQLALVDRLQRVSAAAGVQPRGDRERAAEMASFYGHLATALPAVVDAWEPPA